MAGKGTTRRTIRVPDVEWTAAQNAAAVLKTDVSTEIRTALRALVKRAARTAKPDTEGADLAWTCRECGARITDVQPETWLAVPCGHHVTHVQMVTMTYRPPSWPVALAARTAKPDTEETP